VGGVLIGGAVDNWGGKGGTSVIREKLIKKFVDKKDG